MKLELDQLAAIAAWVANFSGLSVDVPPVEYLNPVQIAEKIPECRRLHQNQRLMFGRCPVGVMYDWDRGVVYAAWWLPPEMLSSWMAHELRHRADYLKGVSDPRTDHGATRKEWCEFEQRAIDTQNAYNAAHKIQWQAEYPPICLPLLTTTEIP